MKTSPRDLFMLLTYLFTFFAKVFNRSKEFGLGKTLKTLWDHFKVYSGLWRAPQTANNYQVSKY